MILIVSRQNHKGRIMSDLDLECDLLSPPKVVYSSWMDSWIHGAITEALAAINPVVEGDYRLWSGSSRRFSGSQQNDQDDMENRWVFTTDQLMVTTTSNPPSTGPVSYFTSRFPIFLGTFLFWQDFTFHEWKFFGTIGNLSSTISHLVIFVIAF